MVQELYAVEAEAHGVDVLADWVRERTDTIAEAATDAIWQEVAAYAALADTSLRAEVAAHCRQVFTGFLASMRERRHPTAADFPWTAEHAMRRVSLGIGLSDFMQAFRIGQIALWDHILMGVREHPGTKDAALSMVHQVMRGVEVASTAAAEAYLEAQQHTVADSARLARDLLEDLLAGRPPTVTARLATLTATGLDDDVPLVVAAGCVPEPEDAADRQLLGALRAALVVRGQGLVVVRQDELVAVLPASAPEAQLIADLEEACTGLAGVGVFPSLGVSTVRRGLDSVPGAYDEARLALGSLEGEPGVRSLSSLSTLDFLVHSHGVTARRLVRPEVRAFVLEDLAAGGTFLDTLRSYVASDLNAKVAAVALHVHANTVYYRLERIAERTGCDIRRVEELIDLLLAVRLVRSEVE
ncbi:CdaR family transcriptional regulator [Nocardioides sp.]|uniref:PucR family transcriptional regulator n=1 Tax=Nocardioides sp. TaxID=35761 RepID=UPI00273774A4|nr:helix-turn-helix domain-containing protein [Nocardioides sp.]MDP3891078.1 helix-turn-helix domain-containing protein [Nocardioides sp.]